MFAGLFFISHSNHSSLEVKWDHLSVDAHTGKNKHLQLIHSPQPTLRSHFCMLAFNTTFYMGLGPVLHTFGLRAFVSLARSRKLYVFCFGFMFLCSSCMRSDYRILRIGIPVNVLISLPLHIPPETQMIPC